MGCLEFRGMGTLRFRWLGPGPLPPGLDLRRCGWTLDRGQEPGIDCIGLVDAADLDRLERTAAFASFGVDLRRGIVVTGVEPASRRAALLQVGFGEAISAGMELKELSARASRTAEFIRWLPRRRRLGDLELDLLAREAYARDQPLNLNPREFALIWRLADCPDRAVSKQALIQDVWRMGFVPATNSIAVHMSRLRRKLGFAGIEGLIETVPDGGYRLRVALDRRDWEAAA